MKTVRLLRLQHNRKDDIRLLVDVCQTVEPVALSYPYDGDLHFLMYDGKMLVSVLGLYNTGKEFEVSAFTHPDYRSKGLFKELLLLAKEEVGDKLVLVNDSSKTAFAVCDAIGAKEVGCEVSMDVILSSEYFRKHAVKYTEADILSMASWEILPYENGKVAYLYAFEINKKYRGKGLGKDIFVSLLKSLFDKGYLAVSLQVSSKNIPAMKIYQNCNFKIRNQLRYFRV